MTIEMGLLSDLALEEYASGDNEVIADLALEELSLRRLSRDGYGAQAYGCAIGPDNEPS